MIPEPQRLSDDAATLLVDSANELPLSAASSLEIAIKQALDRLRLPSPPARYVPETLPARQTGESA